MCIHGFLAPVEKILHFLIRTEGRVVVFLEAFFQQAGTLYNHYDVVPQCQPGIILVHWYLTINFLEVAFYVVPQQVQIHIAHRIFSQFMVILFCVLVCHFPQLLLSHVPIIPLVNYSSLVHPIFNFVHEIQNPPCESSYLIFFTRMALFQHHNIFVN